LVGDKLIGDFYRDAAVLPGQDRSKADDYQRLDVMRQLFNRQAFAYEATEDIVLMLHAISLTRAVVHDQANRFNDPEIKEQMMQAAKALDSMANGVAKENICDGQSFTKEATKFRKDDSTTHFSRRDTALHELHCDLSLPPVGYRGIDDVEGSLGCTKPVVQNPPTVPTDTAKGITPEVTRVPEPVVNPDRGQSKFWLVLLLAFLVTAFVGIGIVAFRFPDPTPTQEFFIRVGLALLAAGFGATLPGTMDFKLNFGLHATGALALFAFVYYISPKTLHWSHQSPTKSHDQDREKEKR
jgi:hypothetical protein